MPPWCLQNDCGKWEEETKGDTLTCTLDSTDPEEYTIVDAADLNLFLQEKSQSASRSQDH